MSRVCKWHHDTKGKHRWEHLQQLAFAGLQNIVEACDQKIIRGNLQLPHERTFVHVESREIAKIGLIGADTVLDPVFVSLQNHLLYNGEGYPHKPGSCSMQGGPEVLVCYVDISTMLNQKCHCFH